MRFASLTVVAAILTLGCGGKAAEPANVPVVTEASPELAGPGPFQKTFYAFLSRQKENNLPLHMTVQEFDATINAWVALNPDKRILRRHVCLTTNGLATVTLEYESKQK